MDDASQVVPVLRYEDVEQAASWLCRAFGFRRRRAVKDAAGDVSYILLTCGRSAVLIRPVLNSDFDDLMVQPGNAGAASTQVCYLTVSDLDRHYRRADAAGARIEIAPGSDGLGGDFYICRDLDGHVWSFGTRNYRVAPRFALRLRAGSRRASQWASVVAVAALAAGAWAFHDGYQGQSRQLAMTPASVVSMSGDVAGDMLHSLRRTAAELDRVREDNVQLTAEVASVTSRLRQQRTVWERAGAQLAVLQADLAGERKARDAAVADAVRSEHDMKALRADLDQQKQHQAVLQQQLQVTTAALLEAQREAASPRVQPSSIQTETKATPRAPRAIPVRPAEAIACYRQLMRGRVGWGGGAEWLPVNAHALCKGTRNARQTIGCFEAGIRAGRQWREAVDACRAT
jgi:uncharacterized glyoxalase superfamily protein PhnB